MTHSVFSHMTADMKAAFPDADFVVAVKSGKSADEEPDFQVYASKDKFAKLTTTDFTGMTQTPAGAVYTVQPSTGEMLKTVSPDQSTVYCITQPYWYWYEFDARTR